MAALECGARYRIVNVKSGTSLDLYNSNKPYVARGWASHGGPNQVWVASEEHGCWHLKNITAGRYLAIDLFSQLRDGLHIIGSYTRFNWKIAPDEQDPSVMRIFIPGTTFEVDLSGGGPPENGTQVHLWSRWSDGITQRWKFEKHPPPILPRVPKKIGRFYHETVALEVNGVVYRVSRYEFEKWSLSIFRDALVLPEAGSQRKGDSDEDPIKIDGCTNAEFENLLEVMYPFALASPQDFTKEKWVGVLKLSRLLDMPDIATRAIKSLDECKLTPIEKIILGEAHGVITWTGEGYAALTNDFDRASLEELSKLGWEKTARLLWAHRLKAPQKDVTSEDIREERVGEEALQVSTGQREDLSTKLGTY